MVPSKGEEMSEALKNLFPEFDRNGNGAISFREFMRTIKKIVEGLEFSMSNEEIIELFEELDTNGNGEISEEEFEEFPNLMNRGWFWIVIAVIIVVACIICTSPNNDCTCNGSQRIEHELLSFFPIEPSNP